ncbi:MAG: ATP-binding protein [Ketobacter sp.]
MFKRLYIKIALGLVCVFVVVGALVLWFTSEAMNRYSQAVTQRLNESVAMYVSDELQLIANGIANTDALKQLAHHAMIINPSIEVYLLDLSGRILAHALPQDQVLRKRVDLAPVLRFLRGTAALPVLGDDPGSLAGRKVFSAHEVRFNNKPEGYIYIVLQGKRQDVVEDSIVQSQVFRVSALAVLGCLAFGLLSALLLFYRFTRRLQHLSWQAEQFFNDHPTDQENIAPHGDELQQLEAAIQAMQGRITSQVEQIRQADDMRRELVANISHDLRTPLTNMLGYIETLLLKHNELNGEQQLQYLEITRNHGQRLGRLVADLFELAKLDSNAVEPRKEPFSMAELIQDVVQDFSMRADEAGIELRVTGDLDDTRVNADIRLIERVIENLLDNALRHTPRGGGVVIQIQRLQSGVRVSVSDTGDGIAQQDIPYVFNRFFHVKDARQQSLTSTGLGLAIVKRILDLHLSSIKVQSQLHQGTTFEFELSG